MKWHVWNYPIIWRSPPLLWQFHAECVETACLPAQCNESIYMATQNTQLQAVECMNIFRDWKCVQVELAILC